MCHRSGGRSLQYVFFFVWLHIQLTTRFSRPAVNISITRVASFDPISVTNCNSLIGLKEYQGHSSNPPQPSPSLRVEANVSALRATSAGGLAVDRTRSRGVVGLGGVATAYIYIYIYFVTVVKSLTTRHTSSRDIDVVPVSIRGG